MVNLRIPEDLFRFKIFELVNSINSLIDSEPFEIPEIHRFKPLTDLMKLVNPTLNKDEKDYLFALITSQKGILDQGLNTIDISKPKNVLDLLEKYLELNFKSYSYIDKNLKIHSDSIEVPNSSAVLEVLALVLKGLILVLDLEISIEKIRELIMTSISSYEPEVSFMNINLVECTYVTNS